MLFKKILGIMIVLLIMSACTSNSKIDIGELEVEQEDINTIYKPVDKKTAEQVLPYEMKFPSYFPFEHEETKVTLVGWEQSKDLIVATIQYPSIEQEEKWIEGSFTQPAIPVVTYNVANFDRYYSSYADMTEFNEIKISNDVTGLFRVIREINGAEMYWFDGEKEYSLQLMYFSDDPDELKEELIKIANSI